MPSSAAVNPMGSNSTWRMTHGASAPPWSVFGLPAAATEGVGKALDRPAAAVGAAGDGCWRLLPLLSRPGEVVDAGALAGTPAGGWWVDESMGWAPSSRTVPTMGPCTGRGEPRGGCGDWWSMTWTVTPPK